MKRLFWLTFGAFVATVSLGTVVALAGMTVKGEIVKISGDIVHVKDTKGNVHEIHNDPGGTRRTGEVKVGAMIEADVTGSGHANSIMAKMMEVKEEMKKEEKKEMKKETKRGMKK